MYDYCEIQTILSHRNSANKRLWPNSQTNPTILIRTQWKGLQGMTKSSLSFWCSVTQLCLTLWDLMDCSTPGFPVLHYLPEFAQNHIHWANNAIQPSHPLSPPSSPAFNLFQHQGLFQWAGSSHHVAKVLEFQLQHQSFHWIFSVDIF